jgi:hypothetical protein
MIVITKQNVKIEKESTMSNSRKWKERGGKGEILSGLLHRGAQLLMQ